MSKRRETYRYGFKRANGTIRWVGNVMGTSPKAIHQAVVKEEGRSKGLVFHQGFMHPARKELVAR